MKDIRNLDLHMHSSVSDGTDTPEELLEKVKAAGLELFALTDHDEVKGYARIAAARRAGDPRVLSGAEFSCRDRQGKYHILGYGFDPNSEGIRRVLEEGHQLRLSKLQQRLDFLKETWGFSFTEEELETLKAMDSPGKPHIGNLMVRHGYAATREEAIKEYIDKLHLPAAYVLPETAIRGILEGGGIPVLAHPAFGSGNELILGEDMDQRLRRLMDFGLRGVEAFYSGFSRKLREEILSFAEKYGLLVTAGSDYHGKNKLVEIRDTGLTREETVPGGMIRFLEETGIL